MTDLLSAAAGVLVVLGALLAFSGSLGLLRLKTFYERVHPPTMGTTLGTGRVVYFEAALVIGMLGFVSTVALAKFLMRGEVIE